jgi:hypothetical protein
MQRKLFYDGTNFWSFYFDGTDTSYRYSTDGGLTWTDGGPAFSTTGVRRASIWYDSSGNYVYIVGEAGVASTNVLVRKGTVSPSSHAISWGSEGTIAISTYTMLGKTPFICMDASGYLWVVSISKVNNIQQQYKLRSYQSSAAGDVVSAWVDRGNAVNLIKDPSVKACLVPGKSGSGTVVWTIATYEGVVSSARHTGSGWATVVEIYAGGADASNSIYAPPSAVTDSRGTVHVVYGTGEVDGASAWTPNIHYVYNTSATTWSAPVTLNSAGGGTLKFPTISLDSSTGNLFAVWIADGTSADSIVAKKNVSGTWSFLSLDQTTYSKAYLTSIYSVSGEAYICWQWTQNTTAPMDVVFHKIPEFSEVVVPVLFMLTIFIAIYRRRSRPEEEQ